MSRTEEEVVEMELDADEAWVAVHETADLMPIEGIEPRQHRVRLQVNGFAFVNARTVEFDFQGKKAVVRYCSFRRGAVTNFGALTKPLRIQRGDRLTFQPGNIRLGIDQ